jgi:hypothetical protein
MKQQKYPGIKPFTMTKNNNLVLRLMGRKVGAVKDEK